MNMNTEIDFNGEKKWTIVISHIDSEKMEAWVQNVGMTESMLRREFKISNSNGFEKEMSCNEMKTMLNYVTTNCIIEAVLEIENHYNTDQKTINEVKRNIEKRLKGKGYTIIEHCFSSGEINVEPINTYETRAYLKLLNDRCEERKHMLAEFNDEIKVRKNEIENTKNEIATLKNDKAILQEEFDILCNRYNEGKKYLKDVDKEVEKYKSNIGLLDDETAAAYVKINKQKKEITINDEKIKEQLKKLSSIEDELAQVAEEVKYKRNELNEKHKQLDSINTKTELATIKYNELLGSLEKYLKLRRQL